MAFLGLQLKILFGLMMAVFLVSQSGFAKTIHKEGVKPNRLIKENSPYLRQHALNPIDWYPWGIEAFAKAKRENKPIFLSIGYSTCHWCHVMEEESFSQADIAKILNKYFVSIKVDRERRPDLDERFMMATQLMTGTGGWPNNVFLTPEQKPFFAGGYFSKKQLAGLLFAVQGQWRSKNRVKLLEDGEKISALIHKTMNQQVKAQALDKKAMKLATAKILSRLDPFYGGFATAPKFPNEPSLMFLAQMALHYKDKEALDALKKTVDAILDGGIHDHVGGGFHRYAVDNAWLVPHFEKMLYNQAQMVRVLQRLYILTGRRRYLQAAKNTADFVLREMTSPKGGFYSAYDADSKGGEGRYYTWSLNEIKAALPLEEAAFAIDVFGMSKTGNFEGYNILHFPGSYQEQLNKTKYQISFAKRVSEILLTLQKHRNQRKKPHLDKKIVVSWNGLMITALAEMALIAPADKKYQLAAQKAYGFIENHMADKRGRLLRTWYDGKAEIAAQLSDYAAMSVAALCLYDLDTASSFERAKPWRRKAQNYLDQIERLFLDKKSGSYFMTKQRSFKKRDDGAVASGNALTLEALAKMTRRSDDVTIKSKSELLLGSMSGLMVKEPFSAPYGLYAADLYRGGDRGVLAYGAKGHVRIGVGVMGDVHGGILGYNLVMTIEEGWHINANKPLEDFFIPTSVTVESVTVENKKIAKIPFSVLYPKETYKALGFNGKKMALYEGKVLFSVIASVESRKIIVFNFQACSEKICLEPEEGQLFLNGSLK